MFSKSEVIIEVLK